MKLTSQILFLFFCFSQPLTAQVTAIMTVKVNVVSGSKVTCPTNLIYSSNNQSFNESVFWVSSTPNSDLIIKTKSGSSMKNTFGDTAELITESNIEKKKSPGKHKISISADFQNPKKLEGNYNGSITTVINYL